MEKSANGTLGRKLEELDDNVCVCCCKVQPEGISLRMYDVLSV